MKAFSKMVTAAGFQLKEDGWYATDFRNTERKVPRRLGDGESGRQGSGGCREQGDRKGGGKDVANAESKAIHRAARAPRQVPESRSGGASQWADVAFVHAAQEPLNREFRSWCVPEAGQVQ
jgi:hypothetical protein